MSTVLIVDDNPQMHRLYRAALQRGGYRLLFASSGGEALLAMPNHLPDVILLDLAMPEMDGIAFLKVVRGEPEWRKLPVVVITAFGTGQDLEVTQRLGVSAHLVKANFSVKELRTVIDKCLALPPQVNAA